LCLIENFEFITKGLSTLLNIILGDEETSQHDGTNRGKDTSHCHQPRGGRVNALYLIISSAATHSAIRTVLADLESLNPVARRGNVGAEGVGIISSWCKALSNFHRALPIKANNRVGLAPSAVDTAARGIATHQVNGGGCVDRSSGVDGIGDENRVALASGELLFKSAGKDARLRGMKRWRNYERHSDILVFNVPEGGCRQEGQSKEQALRWCHQCRN
jgi:hypothetical protein